MFNDYKGFIALDGDGVFSDTMLGRLRRKGLVHKDVRVADFIYHNPQLFSLGILSKFDVQGSLAEAITLLAHFVKDSNSSFVFLSSWISNSKTSEAVDQLFREVSGVEYDKPFVCSQIQPGHNREDAFFAWLKANVNLSSDIKILAIDDSTSHFPTLESLGKLISPCGRTGYTVDDHLKACIAFKHKCSDFGTWLNTAGSYLSLPETSAISDVKLNKIIETVAVEDISRTIRVLTRMTNKLRTKNDQTNKQ